LLLQKQKNKTNLDFTSIKSNQNKQTMSLGSVKVLVDIDQQQETIFVDEVEDGLASSASSQVDVWKQELQESLKVSPAAAPAGALSSAFVDRIANRIAQLKQQQQSGASKKGGQSFAGATRVQPRFKQAAAFDAKVKAREQAEHAARQQQQAAAGERSEFDWIGGCERFH